MGAEWAPRADLRSPFRGDWGSFSTDTRGDSGPQGAALSSDPRKPARASFWGSSCSWQLWAVALGPEFSWTTCSNSLPGP